MPFRELVKPEPWSVYRLRPRPRWSGMFFTLEWCWDWLAWYLNNWRLVEVLERLGSFSVLVAVIFYFAESGKRTREEHYQAWQVINTAQGKGGSGGRIEALQQLNAADVPLIGVDASDAFLQGVKLDGARLLRCDLSSADLRESSFRHAMLQHSNLHYTNFRGADLGGADFKYSDMADADLTDADPRYTDLRYVDLADVKCERLAAATSANVYGVRNASTALLGMLRASGSRVDRVRREVG